MKARQPKYMGSGIYVHMQFRPQELVKGDTFFDADLGEMIWNGGEWVSNEGNMVEITRRSEIWPGQMIYIEKTGLIMLVTKDTGRWRKCIPAISVRYLLAIGFSRIYRFD